MSEEKEVRSEVYERLIEKINQLSQANETQYPKLHSSDDPRYTHYFKLCLKDHPIHTKMIEGKLIKKITLIWNNNRSFSDPRYLLEVVTVDNTKNLLYIDTYEKYASLEKSMLELNVPCETAFQGTNIKKLSDWSSTPVRVFYNKAGCQKLYNKLHSNFARFLNTMAASYNIKRMKLFAFGCGEGNYILQ